MTYWQNAEYQVYSTRDDLNEHTFELLVYLTVRRRSVVTAANALALSTRDNEFLSQCIREDTNDLPLWKGKADELYRALPVSDSIELAIGEQKVP